MEHQSPAYAAAISARTTDDVARDEVRAHLYGQIRRAHGRWRGEPAGSAEGAVALLRLREAAGLLVSFTGGPSDPDGPGGALPVEGLVPAGEAACSPSGYLESVDAALARVPAPVREEAAVLRAADLRALAADHVHYRFPLLGTGGPAAGSCLVYVPGTDHLELLHATAGPSRIPLDRAPHGLDAARDTAREAAAPLRAALDGPGHVYFTAVPSRDLRDTVLRSDGRGVQAAVAAHDSESPTWTTVTARVPAVFADAPAGCWAEHVRDHLYQHDLEEIVTGRPPGEGGEPRTRTSPGQVFAYDPAAVARLLAEIDAQDRR